MPVSASQASAHLPEQLVEKAMDSLWAKPEEHLLVQSTSSTPQAAATVQPPGSDQSYLDAKPCSRHRTDINSSPPISLRRVILSLHAIC